MNSRLLLLMSILFTGLVLFCFGYVIYIIGLIIANIDLLRIYLFEITNRSLRNIIDVYPNYKGYIYQIFKILFFGNIHPANFIAVLILIILMYNTFKKRNNLIIIFYFIFFRLFFRCNLICGFTSFIFRIFVKFIFCFRRKCPITTFNF